MWERAFSLQPQVCMEIHLCGLHGFVPEPQGDHGPIDTMMEQLHRRTVSKHMRRDALSL